MKIFLFFSVLPLIPALNLSFSAQTAGAAYRLEAVRAVARKDAEWAKTLSEQVLKEYERTLENREEIDNLSELFGLLSPVKDLVGSDPNPSRHLIRRVMRCPLDYQWCPARKNGLMKRRNSPKKTARIEHRAVALFESARRQLDETAESAGVFDIRNSVSKPAGKAGNSVSKAQVLPGLAHFYERVDHTAALDELGKAVRIINAPDDPAIFSTFVYRQITGKDPTIYAVFHTPGYNPEAAFKEIGKNDFELSLSHVKGPEDEYFRMPAVLAAAKNCVGNASPDTSGK